MNEEENIESKKLEQILKNYPELNSLPADQRQEVLHKIEQSISISASNFSGPIPPPDILNGYNKIIKNGADRIIKMAEKEQEHRHQLNLKDQESQTKLIETDIKEQEREFYLKVAGMILGFILAIAFIGASVYLSLNGHDAVATAIIAVIGTIVSIFVLGRFIKAKNNDKPESK